MYDIKNIPIQNLPINKQIRFVEFKISPSLIRHNQMCLDVAFRGDKHRGGLAGFIKWVAEISWWSPRPKAEARVNNSSPSRRVSRVKEYNGQRDFAIKFFTWFMSENRNGYPLLIQKSSFTDKNILACEPSIVSSRYQKTARYDQPYPFYRKCLQHFPDGHTFVGWCLIAISISLCLLGLIVGGGCGNSPLFLLIGCVFVAISFFLLQYAFIVLDGHWNARILFL
jgi:hypothetical protein